MLARPARCIALKRGKYSATPDSPDQKNLRKPRAIASCRAGEWQARDASVRSGTLRQAGSDSGFPIWSADEAEDPALRPNRAQSVLCPSKA